MIDILIAVTTMFSSFGAAYFAYRKSVKASEAATRQAAINVEAEAYARAKKLYEDGIREMEKRIDRMRSQLDEEQKVSAKLRKQLADLELVVARMRKQLINLGMDLPLIGEESVS